MVACIFTKDLYANLLHKREIEEQKTYFSVLSMCLAFQRLNVNLRELGSSLVFFLRSSDHHDHEVLSG